MTTQPNWKLLANLGDVNPIDYGGYFVYEDTTGVYPPEAELLYAPERDSGKWKAWRFALDRCTFIDGILSDNQFHPEHPAWFADDIQAVADFCGQTPEIMIADLCSENPIERARAYQAIGDYHGYDNLDDYPLTLTRAEAEQRYADELAAR